MTKVQPTDKPFKFNKLLVDNLRTLAYNHQFDYDFVIIISGNNMTRVGKSVLAQQIGYYFAYHSKTPFTVKNIIFEGSQLREKAKTFPPRSVFIYDEARAELDSKKVMTKLVQDNLDFFSECGKYNHIFIIVLPNFYELPSGLATSRSRCLFNCYEQYEKIKVNKDLKRIPMHTKEGDFALKYLRGYYNFYSREKKNRLYNFRNKDKNYNLVKRDFSGEWDDYWVIPFEEYEKEKDIFLARSEKKKKTAPSEKEIHSKAYKKVYYNLKRHNKYKFSELEISQILGITRNTLFNHRKDWKKEGVTQIDTL